MLPFNAILVLFYFVLVICGFYILLTRNHDFWKRQNIPFIKPYPMLGSMDFASFQKPLHELEKEWYNTYGRIYGRYEGLSPVLCIGDPEILKRIFVKDFHIFQNRRDLKFHDPIMDNTLFVLEGESWRRVRNIVTPTFTTAKLKRILPLLNECCDVLVDGLYQTHQRSEKIDCQKHLERFVLHTIGRCAFGVTFNALRDPNNKFVEKSKKLLEETFSWRTILTVLCPKLMKLFRIKLLNPETTVFYKNMIVEVLQERKHLHVVKNDFLQMLLDAEKFSEDSNNNGEGTVCPKGSCSINSVNSKMMPNGLSRDEILSQCITFFIAGFDPTISMMSNVFYHLAKYPEYQERVVEEMKTAIHNHNGEINYEALSEMKFTDAVFNECLRLCPAMARHERRCEEDYYIEEKNIVLKKGMLVSIPVYSIQRDPEWYPEPDVFKPERFYDIDPTRPQHVFLPFGAGRRICVGMRFVQMQVKLCLAKVLIKFQISPPPTMPDTLEIVEVRNILKVGKVEICLKER